MLSLALLALATAPVPLSQNPAVIPASAPPARVRAPGTHRTLALGEGLVLDLVWAPPGTFTMGSLRSEKGRNHVFMPGRSKFSEPFQDMEAQHEVTLHRGFWVGQTEVTQAQYEAVMGENPSQHKGAELPVESVSWYDAHAFLEALNKICRDGHFRLLTEAEWEYAARAGTQSPFAGDLGQIAWQRTNSERRPHAVATLTPNAWGIFDMHGNVREWCEDRFGVLGSEPASDPLGADEAESASARVESLRGARLARGGSFNGRLLQCRSADRGSAPPSARKIDCGFRIAFEANVN